MVQAISWMWQEATATLPSQVLCFYLLVLGRRRCQWVLFYCESNEPKFPFEMSDVFMHREAMNLRMNFLIIISET